MKYRKKPVVIEAIQWNGDNLKEVMEFIGSEFKYESNTRYITNKFIITLFIHLWFIHLI